MMKMNIEYIVTKFNSGSKDSSNNFLIITI